MPWSLFETKRPTLSKTSVDLLALFGVMCLFYAQPFLNPTRISYGGDGMSLFLPSLHYYRDAMYEGVIPLWNNCTWGGAPFLASFQGAVLYPPQLLSLIFDTPAMALNFGVFLSLLWLSYGCYLFAVRALELERSPALLIAVAVSCSAFVGAHTDHVNQIAAISWIPWILVETLMLLRYPRVRHALVISLCLCMQILAGHPQYVVYTLTYVAMLSACYFVYYYHRRKREDSPAWFGLAMLGLAIAAGLGLGAAQLLPAAELAGRSLRHFDPPEYMVVDSFPPKHLITLIWPTAYGDPFHGLRDLMGQEYLYNFSEYSCYIGVLTVALALIAVFTVGKEFVVRVFSFLALASVLLAFGGYAVNGAPYQFAMLWYPGTQHLRVPARFLVFFDLSVAVLAAIGFNQVVFYLKERRRVRFSTLAVLRILIVVLVLGELALYRKHQVFRYHDDASILDNKRQGPAWTFLEKNNGDHRTLRLMAEIPYNLFGAGATDPNQSAAPTDYDVNADIETEKIKFIMWGRRAVARLQLVRFQPNLNMLGKIQSLSGYEEGLLPPLSHRMLIGQDVPRHLMGRFSRNVYSPAPDTELLGLLNVKYVIADWVIESPRLKPILRAVLFEDVDTDAFGFREPREPDEYWSLPRTSRYTLYENLDYLPRFVWGKALRRAYNLAELEVDEYDETGLISRDRLEPDLEYIVTSRRRSPLVEPVTVALGEPAHPNGSPNAYLVDKSKDLSGEVVMLETAYPGWVCKWKNKRLPMDRVNPLMMSCAVPQDVERLEFRFEPFSFRLGLFISCCFAMLLTASLFFANFPAAPLSKQKG
ncbi:hypothetical protein JW916_02485 [Candidatus Sumerlaeota bacterium]|nr:hypothetical protein [Candidatus Sumerlaeota bacterium]